MGKPENERYSALLAAYPMVFNRIIDACFTTYMVALCRLCDTGKKAWSLPEMAQQMKTSGKLSAQDHKKFMQGYRQTELIRQKIKIIRDKHIAHREKALSIKQIYALAKLKPNEIRDLIEELRGLIHQLLYDYDQSGLSATLSIEAYAVLFFSDVLAFVTNEA